MPGKPLRGELGSASKAADGAEVIRRGQANHVEPWHAGSKVPVEFRRLASRLDLGGQSFIEEWKRAQDRAVASSCDNVVGLNLVAGAGGVTVKDAKLGARLVDLFQLTAEMGRNFALELSPREPAWRGAEVPCHSAMAESFWQHMEDQREIYSQFRAPAQADRGARIAQPLPPGALRNRW